MQPPQTPRFPVNPNVSQNFRTIIDFMDLAVTKESLPKTKLFGVQLESVMEKQKAKLPFLNVPWLVIKCCHFLLEEGNNFKLFIKFWSQICCWLRADCYLLILLYAL